MFRKLVSFVSAAVIFLCAALPASAETAVREVEVPVPPCMLVLGDSIATGYGLEGYNTGRENCASYANILKDGFIAELPEDCAFKLTNRAVDGMTSEGLFTALKSGELDPFLAEADCILISIGGNDLLHSLLDFLADKGVSPEKGISAGAILSIVTSMGTLKDTLEKNLVPFEDNLVKIAAYVRSKSEGRLIIQTLYDPFEGFSLIPGFSEISGDKIGKLDEIIRKHASDESSGYTVCDAAPEFKGKAKELTNIGKLDIHPNAEGHKLLAQQLDKTIRSGKYTYTQTYEAEPAQTEASSSASSESSSESSSGRMWIVFSIAAGAAVVGAASIIIIKKRGK